jgi:hypothetical protein
MTPLENTVADYAASGITVGSQLMAQVRQHLTGRGVLSTIQLAGAHNETWVNARDW